MVHGAALSGMLAENHPHNRAYFVMPQGGTRRIRLTPARKTSLPVQFDASISVPEAFCRRTRQRVLRKGWIA
jgi:hypothetical protein